MPRTSARRISKDRIFHGSRAASPGTQSQGIRKANSTPLRKSARIQQFRQRLFAEQPQDSVPPVRSESSRLETVPARGAIRKRKLHEIQPPSHQIAEQPYKRPRSVSVNVAPRQAATDKRCSNPIDYWRRHDCRWPKDFFERDTTMNRILARKKSAPSLRRPAPRTESVTDTTSDSAPYQGTLYIQRLAQCGIFMEEDEAGIVEASKQMYISLLEGAQTVPQHSLFCDRLFRSTCRNIQSRNEARVIRDIGLLIVPSAEHLAADGAADIAYLIESTNETWNASIQITGSKPKPDFSVGFRWDTFTKEQVRRLQPFIGDLEDESYFKATSLMYFPFLTCEVKRSTASLDVADRQNAHSMGVAVRAVVELFRLVNREAELHRVILAFSVSHNHKMVQIYGHYPVIDGEETTYYRHCIHTFDFTALDGKERWTSYKFIKNVYEKWVPEHFRRICSAIDEIPLDIDFAASQPSGSQSSERIGLTQESCELRASGESTDDGNGQPGTGEPKDVTPNTSVSREGSKTRRKRKHQISVSAVKQ